MTKLLLLDGNSLTYRAFFALPTDMATAGGQVTNAVFGFTSMLINLVKDHQPDSIVAAFDRPEKTFRHESIPTYKANRDEAPDILRQQMGLVREVVDALGVVAVDLAGYEADDIIATLAEQAKARGDDVVIVTGDRDTYQLVEDPHVKVLYNRRGVSDYAFYDEAGILERTGVTPELYPQYAALRGDPSDNLPGVPGVGEKTAAKLITTYGGIDGIYEHLDAQTPKLRASLAEHEERVRENARVMLLQRDVPVEVDLDDAVLAPKMAEVKRLFEFLEFRSLLDRLNEALGAKAAAAVSSGGEVVEAEVVRPASSDEAAALLGGLEALDVAAAWSGPPGRSELTGLAVVVDPEAGEVAWLTAEHVAEPSIWTALADGRPLRAHQAKPLLRALAALGDRIAAGRRLGEPKGRRAREASSPTSRSTRRSPPTCSTRPRPGTASATSWSATPAIACPRRGRRPGSSTSARRQRTRRRWRRGRRSPSAASRRPSWPRWTRRAWPRCTPRSRTRWCGCWPAWRTSASPSTGPSSSRSTPA